MILNCIPFRIVVPISFNPFGFNDRRFDEYISPFSLLGDSFLFEWSFLLGVWLLFKCCILLLLIFDTRRPEWWFWFEIKPRFAGGTNSFSFSSLWSLCVSLSLLIEICVCGDCKGGESERLSASRWMGFIYI